MQNLLKKGERNMIITPNMLNEIVPKDILPTRLDSALNLYTNINYKKRILSM